MSSELEDIDVYCPTCNVQVSAKIKFSHVQLKPNRSDVIFDLSDTPNQITVFRFSECSRCDAVFLTKAEFCEIPGEVCVPQSKEVTLYPPQSDFDTSLIPRSIARPYSSATASFKVGLYEPCVIMCRKSIEAICHYKGITGGNLKNRIDQLLAEGHIDNKLHDWATGLRLVGNDAAHDIDYDVSKEDAADSIGFLETILLYCFVMEVKFSEFRKRKSPSSPTQNS